MKVRRGYKVELDLNNAQRTLCLKHAGCSRFAWNWGLSRKQEAYQQTGKMPTAIDLHRELNALKKTDYLWMYECSKAAPQEALRDLDAAYRNAYRRLSEKKAGKLAGKVGWPRFKSRKKAISSFRLTGSIHIFTDAIQLPRLGRLRLKEHGYAPVGAKVAQATVSEQAGRWYVSVQIEQECGEITPRNGPVIGIDLGISALATCSDGISYANPKALRSSLKRLRRRSRQLSRKAKESEKSRQSAQTADKAARPDCSDQERCSASSDHCHCDKSHVTTHSCAGARGSERVGNAQEQTSEPSHCRCRDVRVPASVNLQS